MSKFAVINGIHVSNIIIAENKEEAENDLKVTLVDCSNEESAAIGGTYIDGIFYKPVESVEE